MLLALRTMRIYMQEPPQGDAAPRYVQLQLEQDMFGGWMLYHESGREGGRVRLSRQQFLQQDDAVQAFEKARDKQLGKGFKIMFREGLNGMNDGH